MKKIVALVIAVIMTLGMTVYAETIEVGTGSVTVYDFGDIKLHAYDSGDALGDCTYAVETAEGIVLIESTAFRSANEAWKAYIDGLGTPVAGKLMAFHPNGSDIYNDDDPYATENALENWGEGGKIRSLTDGFVVAFGEDVATEHPASAQIVSFGDTVTGLACTGRLSSPPALSAVCSDCVTIAMPGMPMA